MLGYDFSGHFVCFLAQLLQRAFHYPSLVIWWNEYSIRIWPSIPDIFKYDRLVVSLARSYSCFTDWRI